MYASWGPGPGPVSCVGGGWWGLLSVSVSWEGVGVSSPVIAWCPLVEFPSVFKGLRVTNGAYGGGIAKTHGKGGYPWHRPHIYIPIYT